MIRWSRSTARGSVERACRQIVADQCARTFGDCNGKVGNSYDSESQCFASEVAGCVVPQFTSSYAVDESKLAQCLVALETGPCDELGSSMNCF